MNNSINVTSSIPEAFPDAYHTLTPMASSELCTSLVKPQTLNPSSIVNKYELYKAALRVDVKRALHAWNVSFW